MPDLKLVVIEVEELRSLIRESVKAASGGASPADDWVDARTAPMGRRTFLRLAKERAFPVSVVGNKYVARRRDIDAYLEGQRLCSVLPRPEPMPVAPLASRDPIAEAVAQGRLRIVKKAT